MRPLEDIRIIAIEQHGAGPYGSVQLADLGAEVIKIENPRIGGDTGRYAPPFQEEDESLLFETWNRNKRSLSLDISGEAGRRVFEDLVKVSDAVYSNLRGDVPARLRIRYDDLKHLNEKIVCCSLSGFGMSGPRANEPSYDPIVQAMAGWMSVTGEPDGPPTKTGPGLSLIDYTGGLCAAVATLAAIHAAQRDGAGTDCDLALFDVALSLLAYLPTWHLTGGYEPHRTRHSAHASLVPLQNFQTADGWIHCGGTKEKFWRGIAEATGNAGLIADERFADSAARSAHRDELIPILEEAFRSKPSQHWLELLKEAGVPSGPVNSVPQALADPQVEARGLIIETDHPRFGTVRQVAGPVRVGTDPIPHRRAPRRGEDGPDILEKLLGYDQATIDDLVAGGAFGAVDTDAHE